MSTQGNHGPELRSLALLAVAVAAGLMGFAMLASAVAAAAQMISWVFTAAFAASVVVW